MKLSFEEWIKFVFDHPIQETPWYWDTSLDTFWDDWREDIDPEQQLTYVTKLFENAASLLLGRFSPEQIDQGLTMLLSGPDDFAIRELVWSHKLPLSIRVQCITSMVRLFRDVFSQVPIKHACFMWWDELREWQHQEDRDPQTQEVILTALEQILKIPSRDCQMSALHGLGHLSHPRRGTIIQHYLQHTSTLDDELKQYAEIAMAGEVL